MIACSATSRPLHLHPRLSPESSPISRISVSAGRTRSSKEGTGSPSARNRGRWQLQARADIRKVDVLGRHSCYGSSSWRWRCRCAGAATSRMIGSTGAAREYWSVLLLSPRSVEHRSHAFFFLPLCGPCNTFWCAQCMHSLNLLQPHITSSSLTATVVFLTLSHSHSGDAALDPAVPAPAARAGCLYSRWSRASPRRRPTRRLTER